MTLKEIARETVRDLPALLTAEEAAQALRKSVRTLKREIALGRLHVHKSCESGSSRVLIPRAAIEAYVREGLR